MGSSDSLTRLLDAIAGAIFIAALFLLIKAWRWDPPRGRKRCPKCWYDMAGVPSSTCPECGQTTSSDRQLARTRRWKPGIAIAFFLMMAAAVTAAIIPIRRHGWISLAPTSVLVYLTPAAGPQQTPVNNIGQLMRASATGDRVTDELLRRMMNGERFADWQWSVIIRRSDVIHIRDRWPINHDPVIEFGVPTWLSNNVQITADAAPDVIPCVDSVSFHPASDGAYSLLPHTPFQAPSTRKVTLRFTVQHIGGLVRNTTGPLGWTTAPSQGVIGYGSVSIPWTPPVPLNSATPIDSDEVTERIRAGLKFELVPLNFNQSPWFAVAVSFDPSFIKQDAGLSPMFAVSIRRDDDRLAPTWNAIVPSMMPPDSPWFLHPQGLSVDEVRDPERLGHWRLVVRGTNEIGARIHSGTSWWSGEFTVPCSSLPIRAPQAHPTGESP